MNPVGPAAPRVLHSVPGRLRVHLPGRCAAGARRIEERLRRASGVREARVNPWTGNLLIHFDPLTTSAKALLAELGGTQPGRTGPERRSPQPGPGPRPRGGAGRAGCPSPSGLLAVVRLAALLGWACGAEGLSAAAHLLNDLADLVGRFLAGRHAAFALTGGKVLLQLLGVGLPLLI